LKNTDYFLEFQRCVRYKVNWKITCWVFDVVCVAQYCQNTPERLRILKEAREYYRKKGLISDTEWVAYKKDLESPNYPYAYKV